MCGCFGNMCTCGYCLYCVFVLFRLCIVILNCFVSTSIRTTATTTHLQLVVTITTTIIIIIIIIICFYARQRNMASVVYRSKKRHQN
jgi:hypothetical protein